MKFDFITIGGAVEDIALRTDESVIVNNKKNILKQKLIGFEYGAKVVIDKHNSYFGGGAANTAVSFSRLGFKTAIFTSIGDDDRGKRIKNNLKINNVNTKLIKNYKNTVSGYSVVIIGHDSEHIVFTIRGANSKLSINFLEKKALANSDWLYLASLSGNWEETLVKIFSVNNVRVAWNPGKIQLEAGANKLKKFFKKTEILLLNKDEALELVASIRKYKTKTKTFLNNNKNLLKILKEYGVKIVVVTDSGNGVDVYDGEKFYHGSSRLKDSEVVDTTGVGDSFCSSFVAGMYQYNDINKAIELGLTNGASTLKKTGAQNGLIRLKVKK